MSKTNKYITVPSLLALLAAGCQEAGSQVAQRTSPCASIHYLTGVQGETVFEASRPEERRFGIKTRYFYGDWRGEEDFKNATLSNTPHYVEKIASHSANCFADPQVGRAPIKIYSVDERDTEFRDLDRVFDEMVAIKRELIFATKHIKNDLSPKLDSSRTVLKVELNNAFENFYRSAADNTRWLFELTDRMINSAEAMQSGSLLTRALISQLLAENREVKSAVIDRLKSNTTNLLDQYGMFFGPEQKTRLAGFLNQVPTLASDEANQATYESLNQWAYEIESLTEGVFKNNERVFLVALKMRFIYGTTFDSPDKLDQYFRNDRSIQVLRELAFTQQQWDELSGGADLER